MFPILRNSALQLARKKSFHRLLPALVLTSCFANTSGKEPNYYPSFYHATLHNNRQVAFCWAPTRSFFSSPRCPKSTTRSSGASSYDAESSSEGDDPVNVAVELLANKLSKNQFSNAVVLMGAGASVSAGIPDFRTSGTGLYSKLQKYNLPFPEAIFELDYYRDNPMPFVDLCQSIWPGQEEGPKPTITHWFLKLLQDKNCLRRIYTQNIDGLEALAGVSTEYLVECHGHFRESSCIQCRAPSDDCQEQVFAGDIPTCQACGSLVKPNIVFFGEELPLRFQNLVHEDMEKCDLLLVVGTSLLVAPVSQIPHWVKDDCTRVLLNRELVGAFANSKNDRDIYVQGDCDNSVRSICKLAGWEKDLEDHYQG